MDSEELLTLINNITQELSSDQNPYTQIREALDHIAYPPYYQSTLIQLYFLSVLFGVLGILYVSCFVLRWYYGLPLALFRFYSTVRGTYICPQARNSYSFLAAIFAFIGQGCIWNVIRVNYHHTSQINQVLWRALPFFPLWLVLVISTWGLSVMHFRTLISDRGRAPPALLVNGFFLTISFSSLGAIIVLFGITNKSWNQAFRSYMKIDDQLRIMESNYAGNFQIADLVKLYPFMIPFEELVQDSVKFWKAAWIVLVIGTALLSAIYIVFAWSHILTLKRQIRIRKTNLLASVSTDTIRKSATDIRAQNALKETNIFYNNFVITCFLTMSATLYYECFSVWVVTHSKQILASGRLMQITMLVGLWGYGVTGPIGVVLVLRGLFLGADSPLISTFKTRNRSGTSRDLPFNRREGVGSEGFTFNVSEEKDRGKFEDLLKLNSPKYSVENSTSCSSSSSNSKHHPHPQLSNQLDSIVNVTDTTENFDENLNMHSTESDFQSRNDIARISDTQPKIMEGEFFDEDKLGELFKNESK